MKINEDVRASLRLFAFYLANRTLDPIVLPATIDYSCIFAEPSALEQAFAIWANVIDFDGDGNVLNAAHAQRRAAQYIRGYVDQGYVVDPPLEDWELKLHL